MSDPRDLLLDLLERTTGRYVADRLGVTVVTVSRWKTGQSKILNWRHVDALRSLHREMGCGQRAPAETARGGDACPESAP